MLLGAGLSLSAAMSAQAAAHCDPDAGANFAGKTPTVSQLNRVSLECADFRGATLSNISFPQTDLAGADFRNAIVKNADFGQADLEGADFTGATLNDTSFEQASVGGVNLTGVTAHYADFEQVDLSGVSLRGSDLQNADFSQATLKRADLAGADLRGASFDQADLTETNLQGANIAGADLSEATTANTETTGITGLPPLDLFVAIVVLVIALLILRPRLRGGVPGRGAAWLVILVLAGLVAAQAIAASGSGFTDDELVVVPFITLIIFAALYVARVVRRPKNGWAAAGIALVSFLGFYLLIAAGLAVITDNLIGLLPFNDRCSSIACGYGVARGPLGIILGIALIILATILSRLKSLARPLPNLANWEAMQAGGGLARGAAPASAGPASTPNDYGDPPSSQTI